jgi:hypothetical protein
MYAPNANTTFTALNPSQTTTYTVAHLPRTFKPFRSTRIYFSSGLPTGISVSSVAITGAALTGYSATYSLSNATSSIITPAAQPVFLWQE